MTGASARIAVVGYLGIDSIRTSDGTERRCLGGGALYASLAVAQAGLTPVLHAAFGNDLPHDLEASLAGLGIDLTVVERRDHPTRRVRLDYATQDDRNSPHFTEEAWWHATHALAPPRPSGRFDATVLCPATAASMAAALNCGGDLGSVVADTSEAYVEHDGPALLALLPALAIFAPSLAETRALCPGATDEDTLAWLARRAPCVVQKRGAEGLVLARGDRPFQRRPPSAGMVIETTGAGDTVAGALAAGLALGLDDEKLLALASRMAALAVSGVGPEGLGFTAET